MSELQVGFHSSDITPKNGGIPLAGYGATDLRLAARVLDPLECLITAIRKDDVTILLVHLDLIYPTYYITWRKAIHEKTGVPEERIIISATHTHSGPDLLSELPSIKTYLEQTKETIPDCAMRAIEDLRPAKIEYGKMNTGSDGTSLNFVRHYTMTDIEYKDRPKEGPRYLCGDNFGVRYSNHPEKYFYTGHNSEADREMQMLAFKRENADDILLVNFQAHPTTTGGWNLTNLSSDFPYAMRKGLERMVPNTRAVYVQGACGNLNFNSRLKSDSVPGLTWRPENGKIIVQHHAYGDVLAAHAAMLYRHLQPSATDDIGIVTEMPEWKRDHSMDDLVEDAQKVREVFLREGRTENVNRLCEELGFESVYHALLAIGKAKAPLTDSPEINALHFGDVGYVTGPFEIFDTTGKYVKTNSPYNMTLIQGYSCGRYSYLPSAEAPKNCYERHVTTFELGTAEKLGELHVELLQRLKKGEKK